MKLPHFETKKELFDHLVKNKRELIDMKKSETKFTDAFSLTENKAVAKELNTESTDTDSEIRRTIVGNTYLWMDSHTDVHDLNCFAKSISERKDKVWHLHDHLYQLTAKVGVPQSVSESYIDWKKLGVNKNGQTQCLLMDSLIKKAMNPSIFLGYKAGEMQQHSVGMVYVRIELAINDKEYVQEYATWNQYYPLLGNPERAEEKGFMWIVKEAKLIEISCVLEGSNELTGTLDNKSINTQTEPPASTQNEPPFDVIKQIRETQFFTKKS